MGKRYEPQPKVERPPGKMLRNAQDLVRFDNQWMFSVDVAQK